MAKWPGVGERIRQRLIAVGYEKNGRPDILRFCMEKKFFPTYAYKWANASVLPERENLLRLADCLGVSPSWLLFGDEEPHGHGPSRGKAQRRQGRRTAGSLLIALMVGAGSWLGLGQPSGSGAAEATPLHYAQVVEKLSLIRRWRRRTWARPVHLLGCPA